MSRIYYLDLFAAKLYSQAALLKTLILLIYLPRLIYIRHYLSESFKALVQK